METQSATGLLPFLQSIPDPRGREGQRHCHVALLTAMVCATLCNFPGDSGVAQWLRLQPIEFWHALGGRRKPPCEDAFRYLMIKLDPVVLGKALMKWITEGVGLTIGDEQYPEGLFPPRARREAEEQIRVVQTCEKSRGRVERRCAIQAKAEILPAAT